MSGPAFLFSATALVWLSASVVAHSATPVNVVSRDCPGTYDFGTAIDYFSPENQDRIRGIESNHLNSNVENLRQGQSASIAGDLRFILAIVPNHPRAMSALARLAIREGTDVLPDLNGLPVRCWLDRAVVFNPGDGQAQMINGVYLSQLGLKEQALARFLEASRLMPDDANVNYNLGLLYADKKDFETARKYARLAYGGGFPLPGLRNRLAKAGYWP